MIAASVGSNITGKHGQILILDDPLNPEQAASNAERKQANTWFYDTFLSRRILPNGLIIVVMQRLHEDDVTGMLLLENHKGEALSWIHLKIPLECEENTELIYPVSKKEFVRKKGDILQKKRSTPSVVRNLKKKPKLFAGQFQQRPAPAEGNIIKRSWIRYWGDPSEASSPALPTEFDRVLQSWDCSFKGTNISDYVSGLVVGVKRKKRDVNTENSRAKIPATCQN
ncbi:MAG: putative phage-related terminase [Candidatus Sulfotelmatobacter sp.]|nr:putative phage-related terminase [Candidatus Sulfotelmatobacter sp.]